MRFSEIPVGYRILHYRENFKFSTPLVCPCAVLLEFLNIATFFLSPDKSGLNIKVRYENKIIMINILLSVTGDNPRFPC